MKHWHFIAIPPLVWALISTILMVVARTTEPEGVPFWLHVQMTVLLALAGLIASTIDMKG